MENLKRTDPSGLTVDVLAEGGAGGLLARAFIAARDLALARDETWLEGIRAGKLNARPASQFAMRVLPGERAKSGYLAGYSIELASNGQNFRRSFSVHSVASVARRCVANLLKENPDAASQQYKYVLSSVGGPASAPTQKEPTAAGQRAGVETDGASAPAPRVVRREQDFYFEEAPLGDYIERSEMMPRATSPLEGESQMPPMPVFITEDLWQQGFALARRGGDKESAAVFTGRLMRDVRSPEIFQVMDACIEAEHADQKELSVTFSGETWAKARHVLDQRRKRLKRPHERIIGAVHGHNFLPEAAADGTMRCEACAVAQHCGRTTAGASIADFEWFAAVFAGQPWAISLIHGYNARGEDDWRLYHLSDGCLMPRTIRRLLGEPPAKK